MIGSTELIELLYHLVLPDKIRNVFASPCNSVVIMPENALWHFILGLLSNSRITLLHSDFPFIVIDQEGVCDVYHLAKQKKITISKKF